MSSSSTPSAPPVEEDYQYNPKGAAAFLFVKFPGDERPYIEQFSEVLIVGPAGTGKTLALCWKLHEIGWAFPRSHMLLIRQTRTSMTNSVLKTYEEQVLAVDSPGMLQGPDRAHREHYDFPNGSRLIVGGMEDADRIMSTEYDVIAAVEATEISEDSVQLLLTRLRSSGMGKARRSKCPFKILFLDCNPGRKNHWINMRFPEEKTPDADYCYKFSKTMKDGVRRVRLMSVHTDNPMYWDSARGGWTKEGAEYLNSRLLPLTGSRRERLLLGKWVSDTGQVYPEFIPSIHCIPEIKVPPLVGYFGSVDWGWRAAGVFQVWGKDSRGRLYRVVEVYRKEMQLDWWAGVAAKLYKEYDLQTIVCDPSRPDGIKAFNTRIANAEAGRDVPQIAREADNSEMVGLDQVRWGLSLDPLTTEPRMFFVQEALNYLGRDPLIQAPNICCTEDEFDAFVWMKDKEGKAIKDMKPEPDCTSDGLDATRYAAMHAWNRDLTGAGKEKEYAPGTYGWLFKHGTDAPKPKRKFEPDFARRY